MIGKRHPRGETRAGGLQPIKKLLRPRDPAKRKYRPVDLRHFHPATHAPDLGTPASRSDLRPHIRFASRDRNHVGALRRMQRFAQIAGRQQMVVQIGAAQQQDVNVAMQLPMLKPIVEQMHANLLTR